MTGWPQGTSPVNEDRAFTRAHYAECLAGMRHPRLFRVADALIHTLAHRPGWLTAAQVWAGTPRRGCIR